MHRRLIDFGILPPEDIIARFTVNDLELDHVKI